jgi:prevent-host-death family protein
VAITTLSSREFNQNTSRAKKAARKGPVFITDRGRPAHVFLTIEKYRELEGKKKKMTLSEALAMPNADLVDFEPPRMGGDDFPVPADLD